ncbi:translin [Coccidioides immitis H538.4]|uniref:Translin n=1 Tax=Coccidioides immitis H538.4 TaxID=396776 RepID=A0A0J8S5K0_COCIT|nr:translin [Coccidioides immitis H538.4]
MIDQSIFEDLQSKIDEESQIRDVSFASQTSPLSRDILRQTIQELQEIVQALSRRVKPVLDETSNAIKEQKKDVTRLVSVAAKHPFYKFNHIWTRELQNLVFSIQFCSWLGGLEDYREGKTGFLTIEEVGKFLDVPVNLKDQDAFHLTIEEYLLALINLVEELTRLAVNAVTLGDYSRPLKISAFVSEIHSGFQLLNLKNDILRKRSDGIKYSVKKVEDVVYDLSLRNLIPKSSEIS